MPVATGGFRCLGCRVRLMHRRGGAFMRMRGCTHWHRAQEHILGEQDQREQGHDRLHTHGDNVGTGPTGHQPFAALGA